MSVRVPLYKRPYVVLLTLVVLAVPWALFRPELLFVRKHVDEPLPGATSTTVSTRHVALQRHALRDNV